MPASVLSRRTTPPPSPPKSWIASLYGSAGTRSKSVSTPVILICCPASAAIARLRFRVPEKGAAAAIVKRFRLVSIAAPQNTNRMPGKEQLNAGVLSLHTFQQNLAEKRQNPYQAADKRKLTPITFFFSDLRLS